MICPICKNKKLRFLEKINSEIKDFSIYQCINCKFAFQNPLPAKSFLKEFYEKIYRKKYKLKSTEKAFSKINKSMELKKIKEIEKFIKRGKILDIGASTGFFLSEVLKRGNWEAYGIEYSQAAVNEANARLGINIKRGEVTDVRLTDKMDVITMFSVLEHIPNLQETVAGVNKKLKNNGFFILTVPNILSFEFLLYKLMRRKFPGFILEHLYYFTPKSISRLLENNGFEIIKITSRNYSFSFPPGRPLIGIITFFPKLFLEYTDLGGNLKFGNVLNVYAKKIN